MIQRSYGHQAFFLGAETDGAICGILPLFFIRSRLFGRAMVSLPFVDYGGVCSVDNEATRQLFETALIRARELGVSYIELRQIAPVGLDLPVSTEKVSMILNLPTSLDDLWKQLPLERRSRIRKAQTFGLTVKVHGAEAYRQFYRVFAENMRDLGSPVHSEGFFQQVAVAFPEETRIIIVRHGENTVGAGWCLCFKDRLMVPWSSTLRRYLKLYPSFLMFWAALEYAFKQECRVFDFGRSSVGSGTYEFKRGWMAKSEPLNWQYAMLDGGQIPEPAVQHSRFRVLVKLWKRLPMPIANTIGPLVRRYIPL